MISCFEPKWCFFFPFFVMLLLMSLAIMHRSIQGYK